MMTNWERDYLARMAAHRAAHRRMGIRPIHEDPRPAPRASLWGEFERDVLSGGNGQPMPQIVNYGTVNIIKIKGHGNTIETGRTVHY